jgi:hypothetical protein
MNTALWSVQVLWGVFFSLTGFGKVLCYSPASERGRSAMYAANSQWKGIK